MNEIEKELEEEFKTRDREILKEAFRTMQIDGETKKRDIEQEQEELEKIKKLKAELEKNNYKIEHSADFDTIKLRIKIKEEWKEYSWTRMLKKEIDPDTGKTILTGAAGLNFCGTMSVASGYE